MTIPNGVDTNTFLPIKNDNDKVRLKKSLGLPINKKIVLYVGFMIQRKGVDILLDAWSDVVKSDNSCLVLVGSKSFIGQEIDKIFKHNIEKKINSFTKNQIIHKEFAENIHEYYQVADMFIFLSKKEGMPNALLEAMSCGVPSLITPFEGLSDEFGKNHKHYKLTSYVPNQISKDIKIILNDEKSRFLGENAHKNIKKNLSTSKCVDQLTEKLLFVD